MSVGFSRNPFVSGACSLSAFHGLTPIPAWCGNSDDIAMTSDTSARLPIRLGLAQWFDEPGNVVDVAETARHTRRRICIWNPSTHFSPLHGVLGPVVGGPVARPDSATR